MAGALAICEPNTDMSCANARRRRIWVRLSPRPDEHSLTSMRCQNKASSTAGGPRPTQTAPARTGADRSAGVGLTVLPVAGRRPRELERENPDPRRRILRLPELVCPVSQATRERPRHLAGALSRFPPHGGTGTRSKNFRPCRWCASCRARRCPVPLSTVATTARRGQR